MSAALVSHPPVCPSFAPLTPPTSSMPSWAPSPVGASTAVNLVALLQACNSVQRSTAEATLQEFEKSSPGLFILSCAQVLQDRGTAASVRSLAAILLKNAIGAREPARGKQLSGRWNAIDESTQAQVRLAMLDAVSDPTAKDVRRAAALCIARTGMVDIPAGMWPQAVPALIVLITDAGILPEIRSNALWTLGLLADEWTFRRPKDAEYSEVVDQMFVTTARTLQDPCVAIRLAAVVALSHLMQWTMLRRQRNNPEEAIALLQVVLRSCAPSEDEQLRVEALKCLAICAKDCYSHITPVLEELASHTFAAMGSASEELSLAGVDVWRSLSEKESSLDSTHKRNANNANAAYHQVVRRAQTALVPALLDVLVRGAQVPSDDEGESNLLHVAAECLEKVCGIIGDQSIGFLQSFFEQKARTSAFHCQAALQALGAIQSGTTDQAMTTLVEQASPCLVESLRSGTSGLAAVAARAAGAIAEHHLPVFPISTQEAIYVVCIDKLCVDQMLTVQICYCLDMLLVKQTGNMPVSFFQQTTDKLLSSALHTTVDRTRAALLSTVGEMVRVAGDDAVPHLVLILSKLLSWAESAGSQPVMGVVPCLRSLTLRLGAQHVSQAAEKMMQVYIQTLRLHAEEHGCLDAETLRAAGALAKVLGAQFAGAMPSFWPVLQKSMTGIDEPEVCLAGVAAFQDVIHALGSAIQPYAGDALETAIRGLQHREALDMRLRIEFISCIADIALAVGAALPALPDVLRILGEEVTYIHDRQSEIASEVSSAAGKDHGQVINTILRAYEAVVGTLDTGNLGALKKSFLITVLEFVCCFARAMQTHATNASWNLGVKLVGKMALHFSADFAALASRKKEVHSLFKELHRISCETPDRWGGAELRPFAAPLAALLQA